MILKNLDEYKVSTTKRAITSFAGLPLFLGMARKLGLEQALNALPVAAQQVPAARTLKVNVDLVQFDVTVKDQQGRIVQGLAKEDFAIAEDNVPQEISYFDQGKAPLAIALALDVSGCPPADNVPELVHETGGELFSTMTHTVEEVASALTTIVQRLKLRYTIGYYPSNSVHDGKFRRISVKVKVQQWNPFSGKVQNMDAGYVAGLTKRGYYATDPSQKKKAPNNEW